MSNFGQDDGNYSVFQPISTPNTNTNPQTLEIKVPRLDLGRFDPKKWVPGENEKENVPPSTQGGVGSNSTCAASVLTSFVQDLPALKPRSNYHEVRLSGAQQATSDLALSQVGILPVVSQVSRPVVRSFSIHASPTQIIAGGGGRRWTTS